jgi:hypothetical protein
MRAPLAQSGLRASPPASTPSATAPASAPSASAAHQPDDQEEQCRADGGLEDFRDDARTKTDPELREYPVGNECARNADDEVAEEAEARTLDDLARKPAGDDADKQYDEKLSPEKFMLGPHDCAAGGRDTVGAHRITDRSPPASDSREPRPLIYR